MRFSGFSDKGKIRDANEDSYLIDAPIFAVADGMGGHIAGEIASKIAIDTVAKFKSEIISAKKPDLSLQAAFESAHLLILDQAEKNPAYSGLGTTLSAIYFRDNKAFIGTIGDSRIYLIREGSIKQITQDHSLVADLLRKGQITHDEARKHPKRNIITKALGVDGASKGDFFEFKTKPSDKLVIASDGLFTMINDKLILSITNDPSVQLNQKVEKLIKEANNFGGNDNISVIIIDLFRQVNPSPERIVPPKSSRSKLVRNIVELIVLLGVVLVLANLLISKNYFVSLKDNSVSLKQGFNRNILGISLSRPVKIIYIDRKDIPGWYLKRLKNGIIVKDLVEGEKTLEYVESYAN